MRKLSLFIILSFCVSAIAQAQALQGEDIKAQLVKDWIRAKAYTQAYLNTMPADKYGSKAVDSIRSYAQQMLHLAAGNISLISLGTGNPRIFPGFSMEKSAGAQSKDSVSYYVNASYDYAIAGIKNIDASKLGELVKAGATATETRFAILLKAFEHQTHHRGQCTIYIRLLGIRPPNEQLF